MLHLVRGHDLVGPLPGALSADPPSSGPNKKCVIGPGCVELSHCTVIVSPAAADAVATPVPSVPPTLHAMSSLVTSVCGSFRISFSRWLL